MIRGLLSPKYKSKYSRNPTSSKLKLPDNWLEFAPLCKIRGGDGIVSFNPYNYQIKLVKQIEIHQTTIVCKTRQMGITELVANWMLYRACTDSGFFGLVVSKGQSETSNIARRIRRMIESLADYVTPLTDNLQDITIANGGRIKFTNAKPNATRGLNAVTVLLIDEVAFIDEVAEIYKAVTPTMATSGDKAKCILLSTPNTQTDFFFDKLSANNGDRSTLDICQKIREGLLPPVHHFTDTKGICKFFLHYKAHLVYGQIDNYLESLADKYQMSESAVQQEFNLSFEDSQVSVFNARLIKESAIGEYQDPQENGVYFCGLDTSLIGEDYTVLVVLKANDDESFSLVEMYRKRKETHEYHIYQLTEIIQKYDPVRIGVEVNSAGQVYYEKLSATCISNQFEAIKTTQSSKPVFINRLTILLEQGRLHLPDEPKIINEFLSFRKIGNKLEAATGKHDDIVMATAFAVSILPIW